ncbi:hypothetical protein NDU88_000829 [Pleurodeles waltl]|uniref:Uncharacterized protein n=1 Tax=Pleurodeles waltl TaxID=8319 RepID=A0AAV7SYE4_PLEWA|nr:hypothetical protein NDU88_000829 [Pleurodeles waltl]
MPSYVETEDSVEAEDSINCNQMLFHFRTKDFVDGHQQAQFDVKAKDYINGNQMLFDIKTKDFIYQPPADAVQRQGKGLSRRQPDTIQR